MAIMTRLKLTISMPIVLALVACGIDQGGGPAPEQVTQTAAVTYGPIDDFGSIVLNGETIGTVTASILVNGMPASEVDLNVGQVVRVDSLIDNSVSTATLVQYQANVIGPMTAIDAQMGVLTVLGQTIDTDAATELNLPGVASLVDIPVDTVVEVSGLSRPDGSLLATYLGTPAAINQFSIGTAVTAVDLAGMQFTVGGILVDYSQAAIIDLIGGQPAAGQIVLVIGSTFGNAGELIAEQVLQLGVEPGIFSLLDTDLANSSVAASQVGDSVGFQANFIGFIETSNNATTLTINNVFVSFDAATSIVGGAASDLNVGVLVQITGDVANPGSVTATEILIL